MPTAEAANRAVASLAKKVDRLDGLVSDQRRSIEALHKELGALRGLLPLQAADGAEGYPESQLSVVSVKTSLYGIA